MKWGRLILWLIIAIGALMHLLVRDRIDAMIVVFYVLPLPVILGATMPLLLCQKHRKAALVTALVLASAWVHRSFGWHSPGPALPDEIKVVFWNLNRPTEACQPLIELIQTLKPDFVACDEPGPNAATDVDAYKAALPGYDCQFMPRGILWFSKHPSRYRDRGRLDSIGAYAVFEAQVHSQTIRLVTADVYAAPAAPRTGQLKELLAFTNHDPRVIVMGDFNTPSESVRFDPYRTQGLQDALDTAGKGFRETWFYGLPLLSLDHIWLGQGWQVLEARKIWTTQSDHAAVFARIK